MPAPKTDLELMRLQARNLFRFDRQGRLVSTNETPPFVAPRLFLGRTATGNVWYLRHDLPPGQARGLASLLEREPPLDEAEVEPDCLAEAIVILARGQPVTAIHRGPAFAFETAPVAGSSTRRLATGEATPFHPQLQEMGWTDPPGDSQQPFFVIEDHGEIVAICHSSRSSPDAAAAGVSTAPDYRQRGLARRVVASWAADVMAGGRSALYSTTWDNAASRAIAAGFRLRFFGEDCHIT
ncbi:MAG: hypothetical protein C0506_13825 [Anaerolinea sp.]|nr:hypothetical protein [Anaerolinea sp.]